jgi:hypothetical protein
LLLYDPPCKCGWSGFAELVATQGAPSQLIGGAKKAGQISLSFGCSDEFQFNRLFASVASTDIANNLEGLNQARPHSSLEDARPTRSAMPICRDRGRRHKLVFLVRTELPTASVGSSQATTNAVDNSAPFATCPQST